MQQDDCGLYTSQIIQKYSRGKSLLVLQGRGQRSTYKTVVCLDTESWVLPALKIKED